MRIDMQDMITEAVVTRYDGHAFTLFYGSYSTLECVVTPKSDIDLIVIFNQQIKPYRETFRFKEFLFDVFVYDVETLNYLIHTGRTSGQMGLLQIVQDAVIFPAPNSLSDHLKAMARFRASQDFQKNDSEPLRHYITNILDDLEWCRDPDEQLMHMVELHKSVTNLLLSEHGQSGHTRKHAYNIIKALRPMILSDLNSKFSLSLKQSDAKPLIAYVTELLQEFGGVSREGFRMDLRDGARLALAAQFQGDALLM